MDFLHLSPSEPLEPHPIQGCLVGGSLLLGTVMVEFIESLEKEAMLGPVCRCWRLVMIFRFPMLDFDV